MDGALQGGAYSPIYSAPPLGMLMFRCPAHPPVTWVQNVWSAIGWIIASTILLINTKYRSWSLFFWAVHVLRCLVTALSIAFIDGTTRSSVPQSHLMVCITVSSLFVVGVLC